MFVCKCDCGIIKSILRHSLIRGHTKSCGTHPLNDVIFENDYALLDVSTKKYPNTFSKIDLDDVDKVLNNSKNHKGRQKWMVYDSSYGRWGKYVTGTDRKLRLHRYIMDLEDRDLIVDHINGDTLDNRKVNLKIITRAENNKNMRKHINNTSGYTGVTKVGELWNATIGLDNKKINIGNYDTKEEANIAYRAVAKVLGFSNRHGL